METDRYKVDKIIAHHLMNNPIGSPTSRELMMYLPPDYYASRHKQYPVVYMLHGYSGNIKNPTVTPDVKKRMSWLPPQMLEASDWERSCDYKKIDDLINKGDLPPFIYVQPDGSLHLPDKYGTFDIYTGETRTKGSFFVNSKHTGNFEDYILEDIINYVDTHYHTMADRRHRALMGCSMGGYGTLSILSHHPEKFSAAVALSPANFTLDILDWKLIVPLQERLIGRAEAEKAGNQFFDDILDTLDMVYSKDRPLMPTLKRDARGKTISMDPDAAHEWKSFDLNLLSDTQVKNLRQIPLRINCESDDEFGLVAETEKLHATFQKLGIQHEFEIYDEPYAKAFSPHIFGIGYQLIPSFKYLLGKIS